MIQNRLSQDLLMLGITLMLVPFIPPVTAENVDSKYKSYTLLISILTKTSLGDNYD